jgi:23S rRNA (adenine2030-N6)-methyltransferase
MLSYRHAFHAGNHADVLKHAVETLIIEQLKSKDKPFCYLDTHAGGGCYDLSGEWPQKKAEYLDGIARLWPERQHWPELAAYWDIIATLNESELRFYPGSPEIARHLLREQDKLMLMELHNQEIEILRRHMGSDSRSAIHHRDGFEGLLALLPPTPRRGLVLMDPPYELKDDYQRVLQTLKKAMQKWSTGIYALWYPILGKDADRSRSMLELFKYAGFPSVLVAELEVAAQPDEWGMNGSGMLILNAPWQLDGQLTALLPRLCQQLAQSNDACWRLEWLAKPE